MKTMRRSIFVYEVESNFPSRMYGNGAAVLQVEINESLETLLKSDCRLVSKTDLPKPSAQEEPASGPVVPKTPLELCNLLSGLDNPHLGTIVGQLLVSGCVTNEQCQSLLRNSWRLARESDRLRRALLNILENKPPEEDEEEDE